MLAKIEGRRRRGQQRMRWLDGITDSIDMSLSKLQDLVMDREPGELQSMGSDMTEQLNRLTGPIWPRESGKAVMLFLSTSPNTVSKIHLGTEAVFQLQEGAQNDVCLLGFYVNDNRVLNTHVSIF